MAPSSAPTPTPTPAPRATVSGAFELSMPQDSQQALASALASPDASDAVEDALAASIASSAGLDADTVEITRVEESVGGALDFDLGDAAADVAAAFSDAATRDGIERTFAASVAAGTGVNASRVAILGVTAA